MLLLLATWTEEPSLILVLIMQEMALQISRKDITKAEDRSNKKNESMLPEVIISMIP